MSIVDTLRTHILPFFVFFSTESCSLLLHPFLLPPLFHSYMIQSSRSFLHFPKSQITAPRLAVTGDFLRGQPAKLCQNNNHWICWDYVCRMHQNGFLNNPERTMPVISLQTNQPRHPCFHWTDFQSLMARLQLWGMERLWSISYPTNPTDRPGLWLHNLCHKAFVGGSLFLFPSLSPRS